MSDAAVPISTVKDGLADHPRSVWGDAMHRLARNRLAIASLVIVAIFLAIAAAAFAPVFERVIEQEVAESYARPTIRKVTLWAGADIQGRSVFWRLWYGARIALVVAGSAAVISALFGAFLGIIAGYFRGWVDTLVIWLFSTINSIPWVLLMVALAYALKGHEITIGQTTIKLVGAPAIIIALGATSWVNLCRLTRGEVLKLRERDFVVAAHAVGLPAGRILFRHILPNVFHLVIIDFTLNMVHFIQAEVVLSFLGLGITDQPSWGRAIDDGKLELLNGVWWQITGATLFIFILSLALSLLGDALRDALDPRLRGVD